MCRSPPLGKAVTRSCIQARLIRCKYVELVAGTTFTPQWKWAWSMWLAMINQTTDK